MGEVIFPIQFKRHRSSLIFGQMRFAVVLGRQIDGVTANETTQTERQNDMREWEQGRQTVAEEGSGKGLQGARSSSLLGVTSYALRLEETASV